ncbi:MAG: DUF2325 domain-containing protein [Variovorax sp.]|nr:MAG: DUF2325 domain-containing protein [Variovorax sp.]
MLIARPDSPTLLQEHGVLLRHYGAVQERCDRLLQGQREQIARLEAETIRLRAAVIARDTALACARDHAAALELAVVPLDVDQKAVLCIGKDAPDARATRRVIESAGGQFMQCDDTAAEDGDALEASLRAADLVICQTGCLSHDAYWRVQDHCTRTGKRCLLIDQPQPLRFIRRMQAETTNRD